MFAGLLLEPAVPRHNALVRRVDGARKFSVGHLVRPSGGPRRRQTVVRYLTFRFRMPAKSSTAATAASWAFPGPDSPRERTRSIDEPDSVTARRNRRA